MALADVRRAERLEDEVEKVRLELERLERKRAVDTEAHHDEVALRRQALAAEWFHSKLSYWHRSQLHKGLRRWTTFTARLREKEDACLAAQSHWRRMLRTFKFRKLLYGYRRERSVVSQQLHGTFRFRFSSGRPCIKYSRDEAELEEARAKLAWRRSRSGGKQYTRALRHFCGEDAAGLTMSEEELTSLQTAMRTKELIFDHEGLTDIAVELRRLAGRCRIFSPGMAVEVRGRGSGSIISVDRFVIGFGLWTVRLDDADDTMEARVWDMAPVKEDVDELRRRAEARREGTRRMRKMLHMVRRKLLRGSWNLWKEADFYAKEDPDGVVAEIERLKRSIVRWTEARHTADAKREQMDAAFERKVAGLEKRLAIASDMEEELAERERAAKYFLQQKTKWEELLVEKQMAVTESFEDVASADEEAHVPRITRDEYTWTLRPDN